MRIKFENVDLKSSSGPNSFGKKLKKYLEKSGDIVSDIDYDVVLCFIETYKNFENIKLFQRLDGIYFNSGYDYRAQNANILKTFKRADGVIFQSEFNKKLITKYFGEHKNSVVIHNGADIELIELTPSIEHKNLDKYKNVWCCASSWRPHKRLRENIRYFLEYKGENDCLVISGQTEKVSNEPDIFYAGQLSYETLISLYKRSKYFIHLAWLDHCPNVVIDARASGCHIICSSAGGTKEIVGTNSTIIEENEWDFEPTKLYNPPSMDFKRKIKNDYESCYDIAKVAQHYKDFIKGF